ncbi:MAG TPA: methyltransferase domain-containing protein [Candidatus Wallbacteria bacterium]|nr:methyltransferase domain-containing protein [Candidatus Wallbacteria bacterium]
MQKRHDTIIDPELKILQSDDAFCYSTDTILLLEFIKANYSFPDIFKMAELGSGTGGLCIVAARQNPSARVTGIELQRPLNELARESARINGLENVEFKDADLREIKKHFYPETFNLVAANPPYFKLGTGRVNNNSKKAQAKHEIKCTLADVFAAASHLLKKTGAFFLIHHYSRIFDVFSLASQNKFKLICFQPVYVDESEKDVNASHCLFAFCKSYKKEPAVLAPKYIIKVK